MGQCNASSHAYGNDGPVIMTVTGKRRALLVGINYNGTSAQLRGCINDVENQKKVLIDHYGFQESDIRMLNENQAEQFWPYKANILEGFHWLYDGAKAGDLLFFQYSGHGSQYQLGGEMADCICPLDCLEKSWPDSVILDTEIHRRFYDPLPAGCKAVAVFDCCHSGTVANLTIMRSGKTEHQPKARYMQPPANAAVTEGDRPVQSLGIRKGVDSGKYADHLLWVFSGCQDHQTSADAYCDGTFQGAFTWALLKALKHDVWDESYVDLLGQVKHNLRGYTQVPALSTTADPYLDFWYMGRLPAGASKDLLARDDQIGAKKALLVGINYVGTSCELQGCINDVKKQKGALMEHFGYQASDILVLTEEEPRENWPYKARIVEGVQWLMKDAKEGDSLFLHYSGHGSQMNDVTGTEPSGMSDCICPLDCDKPWPAHIILDTEIHEYVYDQLPDGVKLTCVFDCCHSGTVANLSIKRDMDQVALDKDRSLPMAPEKTGKNRFMDPPSNVSTPKGPPSVSMLGCSGVVPQMWKKASGFSKAVQAEPYGDKHLWVYSGCQDTQTSADAWEEGMFQGAFTWAFTKSLKSAGFSSKHDSLLRGVRRNLSGRYTQTPALSTTKAEYFSRYYLAKAKADSKIHSIC